MKHITIRKGLTIPLAGAPVPEIGASPQVSTVAILGEDFIDVKPTMEVKEGDRVKTGQLLFSDKKNAGVCFTAPATGTVTAINRGEKRVFQSLVIQCEEDDFVSFLEPGHKQPDHYTGQEIRDLLVASGLWTALRTRPYGKIPAITANPVALFINATETRPQAPPPALSIERSKEDFSLGLQIIGRLTEAPTYLCTGTDLPGPESLPPKMEEVRFEGPHPAGLPSTHIHFLHRADEKNVVWHLDYQDIIAIGHLFRTGHLATEKVISISGPAAIKPELVCARIGGDINELAAGKIPEGPTRILSGSVLDGRESTEPLHYLGRYHHQIAILEEGDGRAFFNWLSPGKNRFSIQHIFTSALHKSRTFAMNTALWGGRRAIFPLNSYAKVMPLDIIILPFLKSLYNSETEKAKQLGALELIEEDLALCSYVCPGKNEFGPVLRKVLTEIEKEG